MTEKSYRVFVNLERTVLVTLWPDGRAQIATRDESGATWGPPVELVEEKT